jgi:hypothetical protein
MAPTGSETVLSRRAWPLHRQICASSATSTVIDGRDTARAHGSHEMPVWGEKLYELGHGEKGETGVSEVIAKIIAYLNTIQDRRTAMR